MARTNLVTQTPQSTGTVPSFSAANADGHSIAYSKRMMLYVKNGGGASINVTVQTPGSADGLALPDRVVAVGAGAEKIIGNLDESVYRQVDGTILVDFSAVSSVTVAAIAPA